VTARSPAAPEDCPQRGPLEGDDDDHVAVPDVILERATYGRPTWITTWMSPDQAAQRYGDGIARRLFEAGRVKVIQCGKAK
jgi:hypothetical protein